MGRSLFIAEGKNVAVTAANAVVQAKQLRAAILNGIVKGELVLSASLDAYTALFVTYQLNAALNAYTIPGTTLLNGIQRYYKLNGDAVDSVAGANGTTPNVTWVAGKLGTAANFNNDTSRKVIAPSLDLMTAVSISMWVYWTGGNSYAMCVGHMLNGGSTTLNYAILTSGTGLTFYGTGNAASATTPAMSTGGWHHVVATRTVTGIAQFWVDGVPQTPATGPGPYSCPTADFRIGNRQDNYADFPGYIDEVGVWNRVLDPSEIAELRNHGAGQTHPFGVPATLLTQLISYWKLDGNSLDSIGTNNGTDTAVTYSVAKINSGFFGNGTTSQIALPNITALSGGASRTVSMWVQRGASAQKTLYFSGGGFGNQHFGIFISTLSVGDIYLGCYDNDYHTAGGVIGSDRYYHLVVAYDGGPLSTSTVHIYVDGTPLVVTKAGSGTGAANTMNANFAIGYDPPVGRWFDGSIDEVGVWGRALDAGEVAQVYNAGLGEQYPFASPAPITTAMTAYWKMDGNSNDSVGAFNGSDSAGLTYSGANGIINNGVGGFVSASTRITLTGMPTLTNYTMSMWINPASFAGTSYCGLLTQDTTYTSLYLKNSGKLVFYYSSADHASNASIQLGVWTHVVLAVNPGGYSIYINGVLDSSVLGTVPSMSPGQIGNDFANNYFTGAIDEVGLWSRTITASEVSTIYNAGVGVQYPFVPGATPMLAGQKAYWKLDGNSTDALGVYNGTDTAVSYAAGKINNGAVFNGSTSKITLASPVLGKVFSVAAWVYTTSYTNVNQAILADNAGSGVTTGMWLNNGTGQVQTNTAGTPFRSVGTVPLNTWTHIVWVADGVGTRLYLNGVFDCYSPTTPNFTPMWIGSDGWGPDTFTGSIDEVGLWTRPLSAADVLALYNAGAGIQYPF